MTILKLALLGIFFLASFRVGALDNDLSYGSIAERDAVMVKQLKDYAKQLSEQLPMMVDAETQAFGVIALDKVMSFSFRFINAVYNEVDVATLKKTSLENLNAIACQDSKVKIWMDFGMSYNYIYYDKNNRIIARIPFTQYHC
ncbi:MAG: hypothetical protein PHH59_05385 [Methylovulum sp.]|uniref:hypothetical protein n=1 Tax=Methylovulum sp. TaxID=1916980 RepID=UPI0026292D0F|nr:hypothetical protein [Methylovulum sp.]MDD2723445.1 hypothetical protein [Methylovulum sp.]MDD5124082.1 hypothetical protein [Methylovulum sp.]